MTKICLTIVVICIGLNLHAQSHVSLKLDEQGIQLLDLEVKKSLDQPNAFIRLTNQSDQNNLSHYPIRPEYDFEGNESVFRIPNHEGKVTFQVVNRFPNIEVDVFVLTDPQDASSAVLWLNGTGSTKQFEMIKGQSYYLVVDGFQGNIAALDFSIAEASAPLTVCQTSTDTIYLEALLQECTPNPNATWTLNSSAGGVFDPENGTFVPFHPDSALPTGTILFRYFFNSPTGACCEEFVEITIDESCDCCDEVVMNTFNGNVNSDWNTVDNWSLGVLPNTCQSVFVPAGQTVEVNGEEFAICHDIEVHLDASFTVADLAFFLTTGCN